MATKWGWAGDMCTAWIHWTKGCFTSWVSGIERDRTRFHLLLRTADDLKLINYLFLEFSISYFWTAVEHRLTKITGSKTIDKGDYYTELSSQDYLIKKRTY